MESKLIRYSTVSTVSNNIYIGGTEECSSLSGEIMIAFDSVYRDWKSMFCKSNLAR